MSSRVAGSNSGVPERFMALPPAPRRRVRKRSREPPLRPAAADEMIPYNLPHLPTDVVGYILSFLEIKQLVQYGLVARPFRDCHKQGRRLDFGQAFFKKTGRKGLYAPIVGRVMDQHCGPKIQSLKLFFDPDDTENHSAMISGWISKAAQKGIEEFDLDFSRGIQAFVLSNNMFEIETLRILRLCFCDFVLPNKNFKVTGLRLLRVCSFKKMRVQNDGFLKALLEVCTELETLELFHCCFPNYFKIAAGHLRKFKECRLAVCPEIIHISIDAPTLTTFHYYGPLVVLKYGNLEKLTDVILEIKPQRTYFTVEVYKLDKVLYDMSNMEVLTTTSRLLESLCPRKSDENSFENFFCLPKLKEMQLFMEGSRYCNLFTIVALLRKCPSLETLHIDVRGWFRMDMAIGNRPGGISWVKHQQHLLDQSFGPCYPSLKQLKLTGFRFEAHELQLLLYFIENAMNLETVALFLPSPRSVIRGRPIEIMDELSMNNLLQPMKASPKAWIRIYEHFQEKAVFSSKHVRGWHSA